MNYPNNQRSNQDQDTNNLNNPGQYNPYYGYNNYYYSPYYNGNLGPGYLNPYYAQNMDFGYYNPAYNYIPGLPYYYGAFALPGPYTGVGPVNYQRSDQSIYEDIHNQLTQHGRLNASNIEVNVNNGVVTLRGSVDTRQEKRLAGNIVDSVPGVQDLNNDLRIAINGPQTRQIPCGTLRLGWPVVGRDGRMIGIVKQIRNYDFLVDRNMARDIYVPFNACSHIDRQVHLHVSNNNIDNQGWVEPSLFGGGDQP